MRSVLIACLLLATAAAQTPGNAPTPADSFLDGTQMNGGAGVCLGLGDCVNFTEGVTQNDLVFCTSQQEDTSNGCGSGSNSWTFSDTLSSTWHNKASQRYGGSAGSSSSVYQEIGYACIASSSSTYHVSWTGTSGCASSTSCARIHNACSAGAITEDTYQTNTASTSTSISTVSNTITTTALHDLVLTAGAKAPGNGGSNIMNPVGSLGLLAASAGDTELAWELAPTLGSNTASWSEFQAGHNTDIAQTLAFKIPISLGDSALPQGAVSVAYSAQLHCNGGTSSTPTYALSSGTLPTGISLNTSTGAITGTPSVAGTSSPVFTCTDGTNTSPADALSLQILAAFGTPQIVGSPIFTNFSSGGSSVTLSAVAAGDVVTIIPTGVDTHGGTGYLQVINGTGNYVKASDGSPIQKFWINAGLWRAPVPAWVVGPFLSSGSVTISVANNTNASSGLIALVTQFRNVQAIIDSGVANTTVTGNSGTGIGTFSTNYTTPVPNTLLQVATVLGGGFAPAGYTFGLSSPFTDDGQASGFLTGEFGHALITTAQTVTETTTISGYYSSGGRCGADDWCDAWTTLMIGLRPGAPVAAPTFGNGEKIRRQVG